MQPPNQYLKRIGHHWLKFKGDTEEYEIAQWNPGSKTWTRSNGHDRYNSEPLQFEGWEWISYIPYPWEKQDA